MSFGSELAFDLTYDDLSANPLSVRITDDHFALRNGLVFKRSAGWFVMGSHVTMHYDFGVGDLREITLEQLKTNSEALGQDSKVGILRLIGSMDSLLPQMGWIHTFLFNFKHR
jgi:hypothetical protein